MTYVQWLGSWLESYPYYEDYQPSPVVEPRGQEEGGQVMKRIKPPHAGRPGDRR